MRCENSNAIVKPLTFEERQYLRAEIDEAKRKLAKHTVIERIEAELSRHAPNDRIGSFECECGKPKQRQSRTCKECYLRNGKRSHCAKGHALTPENVKVDHRTGWRKCRICANENDRHSRRQRERATRIAA